MDVTASNSDDILLLATVARRYYLEDRSKVDIGKELGISRFKVARLLNTARDRGVVKIEIPPVAGVDVELSSRLRQQLGLRRCVVVNAHQEEDEPTRRAEVGQVAAGLLGQTLTERDVLGLPWSRSVSAAIAALETLPPIEVVQLSGALNLPDPVANPLDVVREAARLGARRTHHFYAPLVATDVGSAQMLRRQPGVADALAQVPRVTVAMVGIGAWAAGASTLYDLATESERAEVTASGAVGEISGAFISAEGRTVTTSFGERLISVGADDLRRIPHVIGLVTGTDRAAITVAATQAGLIDSLVTDVALARRLLTGEISQPA